MTSDRVSAGRGSPSASLPRFLAIAPASVVRAADPNDSIRVGGASDPAAKNLQLGVGQSVIVDLPEEAGEIYVGDPKIANAIVRSARRIYISGVANGQTSIFALAKDGRKIATIEVSVGRDVGGLTRSSQRRDSRQRHPCPHGRRHDHPHRIRRVGRGGPESARYRVMASSTIASRLRRRPSRQRLHFRRLPAFDVQRLRRKRSGNSSRGKVINALTIRGADQVSLRVTVAEIRREIVKQLGVNMSGGGPNGSFTLENPFAINGALATSEGMLNWVKGGQSFSATLQAFERQGVAHTLAEPTVTAVSGESAKFLAGGTIPILNNVQCNPTCQYGFIQQPYGVTLNFTPVVLSQGRIQLRIATEVTDVDYATQVTYSGISIPGFRTRNNTTTVELPSGGSIASAGLISTQTQQAVNGFPALMNVPVLGALFRSRDYQRNETELMIVVTPYIVHAIDPNQIVRPDQNFQDASDPQTWFLGRVNRIYSTSESLQPMPGYAGKIGFITQ